MRHQKLTTKTPELSAEDAAMAAGLIREGKARLEVSVYPWGVELGLSSLCCPVEEIREGETDAE